MHSVNIKEIDDQHKYFVGLINQMFEALENRAVEPVVDGILNQLVAYAKLHFTTEEHLMDKAGYPDLAHQREEHQELLNKLNELMKARATTPDVYKFYYDLMDFLKRWLVDHLVGEDKKFSECLNNHGIY